MHKGNSGVAESLTLYYQLALAIPRAMGIVTHMCMGFAFLGY